jgi:hypothetical protein
MPQLTRHLQTRRNWYTCASTFSDNPPYSPDLAPSDYHQFPRLKNKRLKVHHLSSDEEVIAAAETWFDG